VSNSTLDHFPSLDDVRAGLSELRRVLALGGALVVTLDNGANPVVALRNRLPLGALRRLRLVPYAVGATCGPRRFRRLLVEADFAVLETRVVMHCPRLPAIAAGRLLQRRPGEHERFLAALGGFEALERLPTRSVTGYFIAARCTSYA
jgi:hypothetical protein